MQSKGLFETTSAIKGFVSLIGVLFLSDCSTFKILGSNGGLVSKYGLEDFNVIFFFVFKTLTSP